ncbi:hypothetical protein [Parabacteroides bouchesdurhonensis]|uniref:hypothetical protein n=1 Tax=Parabacteroides bouchesdurhonensis TaxID=1936995 RepID=UPI000C81F377|nr:hypothetical protein [Parabacteroides bouchesdurhonensis]
MKQIYILYVGMNTGLDIWSKELSAYLVKLLSARCQLHLLGDLFSKQSYQQEKSYDLVIVQNSLCFIHYKEHLSRLSKSPVFFIAATNNLNGYIAPFKNLFGVLNMKDVELSAFGIPEEIQLRLNYPVEKVSNYYFYEQQPEFCRIVYCPTGNTIQESDLKLLTFLQKTNALLTIVSDEYQCLKKALPPFVTIVPRSSWLSIYKKAHLVVASGFDAIRAMALCKPCVILGDYGLGGIVTPANYDHLQSVSFRGRKGACFREMVPLDLLEVEIRKYFASDAEEASLEIQKKVMTDYGKSNFDKKVLEKTERIINLSVSIKSRSKRLLLKPCLSSLFAVEESNGKQYLMRGQGCFGEIDMEMVNLLKQCDGTLSVQGLAERNGYNKEEAGILWSNLYELWKEKLILFAL